jgi:hypothetical protein
MGFYINPPSGSKEQWLAVNGGMINPPTEYPAPEGTHYVVHVDNGRFTAALIVYNNDEFSYVNKDRDMVDDPRPRQWFTVPDKALLEVCPQVRPYLA